MLPADKKAGDRAVKTMVSSTSRTNGPNSGLEKTFWRNEGKRIRFFSA
jgi:hypothetical protein